MHEAPTCKRCGAPDSAVVETYGEVLHGHYGSTRFDGTSLIWVSDDHDDLVDCDVICDACTEVLIERGKAEIYHAAFAAPAPANLSKEAYRRLFLLGANTMHQEILMFRGFASAGALLTPDDPDAVEDLRRTLCRKDPTGPGTKQMPAEGETGSLAIEVGRSHATAALLLATQPDPAIDYTKPAEIFAEQMIESDKFWDEAIDILTAK